MLEVSGPLWWYLRALVRKVVRSPDRQRRPILRRRQEVGGCQGHKVLKCSGIYPLVGTLKAEMRIW